MYACVWKLHQAAAVSTPVFLMFCISLNDFRKDGFSNDSKIKCETQRYTRVQYSECLLIRLRFPVFISFMGQRFCRIYPYM